MDAIIAVWDEKSRKQVNRPATADELEALAIPAEPDPTDTPPEPE